MLQKGGPSMSETGTILKEKCCFPLKKQGYKWIKELDYM